MCRARHTQIYKFFLLLLLNSQAKYMNIIQSFFVSTERSAAHMYDHDEMQKNLNVLDISHAKKLFFSLSLTHLKNRVCALHKPLYIFFNYIPFHVRDDENYVSLIYFLHNIQKKSFSLLLYTHLIFFSRFHYVFKMCAHNFYFRCAFLPIPLPPENSSRI